MWVASKRPLHQNLVKSSCKMHASLGALLLCVSNLRLHVHSMSKKRLCPGRRCIAVVQTILLLSCDRFSDLNNGTHVE